MFITATFSGKIVPRKAALVLKSEWISKYQ